MIQVGSGLVVRQMKNRHLKTKGTTFKIEPMPEKSWTHMKSSPQLKQPRIWKKKRTVVTCCVLSSFHYSIPLALRRFASSKKSNTCKTLSLVVRLSKIERTL